jgi:hypothetical protein
LAQLGETKESLNHVRHCAELLAVQSYVHFGGLPYVDLGGACLILGRLDEAQHFGERGVELLSGNLGFRSKALQLVGDIVTHPERFDAERGEAH